MHLTLIQRPSAPIRQTIFLTYLLPQNLLADILQAELLVCISDAFVLEFDVYDGADGLGQGEEGADCG